MVMPDGGSAARRTDTGTRTDSSACKRATSPPMSIASEMVAATKTFSKQVDRLAFADPVTHVYNPLNYALAPHEKYLQRFCAGPKKVLFLGMNPGPFGMVQTGVPFGEVSLVRDYLGIEAPVGKPPCEHAKRPVTGFACTRSEVSGRRLWGAISGHCPSAEQFFEEHFIANYCPLVFMEEGGRNRTPDKLPVAEREALFALCDEFLRDVVELLAPEIVIGIGKFAESRALTALKERVEGGLRVATLLHPSPASPRANAGWEAAARVQLRALGLPLFG